MLMKLFDIIRRGAFVAPDNIAVTHRDKNITYKELLLAVNNTANKISEMNLPQGTKVAIYYENSIEYVILFFAIQKANLITVPLDTSLKSDKINFILNDCDAKLFFVQNKFLRFINEIFAQSTKISTIFIEKDIKLEIKNVKIKILHNICDIEKNDVIFESLISDIDNLMPLTEVNYELIPKCSKELAAIFYTSGSTGKPKGVMLSHLNLIANTAGTIEYLKLNSDDSVIVILPFYYIYGNSLLLTHFMTGGRLVIDNRFAFPQTVLETMIKEKVTGFSGVPSNFMILLTNHSFTSEHLPSLRYVTQAGGAMAPEIIKKVITAFPEKEIFIMYGQTEASPRVTYLPHEKLTDKIGSIGIPVPGVYVKLINDDGQEVEIGEVGEIVVSGDSVMLGYCNQPDEEKQVLQNGNLYTGDLAHKDKDGYFFIVSRKKEIIKVGGNRVGAKEIEERILEHEAVHEVAIISVKDEILGEAIKAYIVTHNGQNLSEKEIQDFVMIKLARHKAPKFVELIDELPKYQSGKVNKSALSEL